MKRKLVLMAIPLVFGLIALISCSGLDGHGNGSIEVSGNVEATEVAISFRIPGRVTERLVDEGQTVKEGEIVAKLDDTDLRQRVAERQAALDAANAMLSELKRGFRPEEIAQGKANLEAAQANLNKQKADIERAKRLLAREVISQREFDAANAAYLSAVSRQKDASEKLALLKKGPRKEQIDAAGARSQQAEKAFDLAKSQMNYATLRSPLSGVVLSKNIEAGEYVQPGTPVVEVANLATVYLRAYVEEPDMVHVKLGQPATVKVDGLSGKKFEGKVSFISSEAEFTPRTVQTKGERVKLVYRIKIDVANPDFELKPGMPADAVIREK